MSRFDSTMDRAKGVMSGFTPGQKAVVAVGVAALILGAFALSRWVAQPTMTPLFSSLSGTDASAVVDELQAQGVTYKLADGGASVLVPEAQVNGLRISLAGKGIPANNGNGDEAGWSLLDKQGITATDFQQNVAYQRALEGELNKTLKAIDGVNTAVVHIAVPKKDVFSDEQDKTTASVLLSLAPGTTLGNEQVQAITNLVAGSVTGLSTGEITITDQTGKLLSSPTGAAGGGSAGIASQTDEQTASYENRLSSAVEGVLAPVVGAGNAVVRVNAQLDFNARETTSQVYTQPTPTVAPLSEANVNEQYSGGGGTAAGGTLGQILPSPLAGAAGGSGAYVRDQSTKNNSVNTDVSKVTAAPGSVQRLTVAVVLNAKTAATLNTGQIQTLVANAVGLDPKRGDSVQVDTLPFDASAAAAAQGELAAAAKAAKTAQYLDLGKKAGIGLLVLIALIMAMRRGGKKVKAIEANASDLPASGRILSTRAAIGPGDDIAAPLPLNAPSRVRVREDVAALVDNQPEEVAAMLQGWLAERSK